MTGECHHFIRHAVTDQDRAQVTTALEYARTVGDDAGMRLAIAQLSPCPSIKETS